MDYSRLVLAFRYAFEQADLTDAPGFLPGFPKGCCGWAAIFMGNYLKTVHGKEPIHVVARHESLSKGHEWLEVDGIILDITLDQFGCGLPAAYWGAMLPFHQGLTVKDRKGIEEIAAGMAIDRCRRRPLLSVYTEIVSTVEDEMAR